MEQNDHNQPQLILIEQETVSFVSLAKGTLIIGRNTKTCTADISFSGAFVSRKHGEITCNNGLFYYMDANSTNGSWINGVRIPSGSRHVLRDRDLIVLYKEEPLETSPFVAMIYCAQGIMKEHRAYAEMIVAGYLNRITQELTKENDRVAEIAVRMPERVEPRQEDPSRRLRVDLTERTVQIKGQKMTLLRDIHMEIPAGTVTLILGGSGAGKTTLMNAIMGYEKANGSVRLGTQDVYRDYHEVKSMIGYVPQQDLMRLNDTVYDTLMNAAEMKLARGMSPEERKARVDKTLVTLGLERERMHTVKKLSGGQRKRLSVAIEYVSNPSLFFLDEPDSGLDGIMARALFRNLRQIADEGKIVMVISHGPDRHEALFDRVIVLAKSEEDNCGRLAFFGTVKEAYRFFDTTSLEEIVQRINRPDEGGDGLADVYIKRFAEGSLHGTGIKD